MTLYLTDTTPPTRCGARAEAGIVAVKLYPAGATTQQRCRRHRHAQDLRRRWRRCRSEGMLLLVHGEVTDPAVDVFDREAVFIERTLLPLRRDFPELKIVLEHITTKEAAQYVAEAGPETAATITAHHLLYNRNAIFTGGIRPHYYCLPVLKREEHRRGAGRGGDVWQRALLPRHRQRAASGRAEGARERLRRLLHRFQRASSCMPKRSRRPARSTPRAVREPRRPGLLRHGAEPRDGDAEEARLDLAGGVAFRRRRVEAAAWRRDARLATRRLTSSDRTP